MYNVETWYDNGLEIVHEKIRFYDYDTALTYARNVINEIVKVELNAVIELKFFTKVLDKFDLCLW